MKFYLVVRDAKKRNRKVFEFDTFKEARAMEEKMDVSGFNGELVIGMGENKEAFLSTFSEYAL